MDVWKWDCSSSRSRSRKISAGSHRSIFFFLPLWKTSRRYRSTRHRRAMTTTSATTTLSSARPSKLLLLFRQGPEMAAVSQDKRPANWSIDDAQTHLNVKTLEIDRNQCKSGSNVDVPPPWNWNYFFFFGNLNLLSHCHAQCHFQTDANLCKLRSTDDLEHIEIDEICLRFFIFLKKRPGSNNHFKLFYCSFFGNFKKFKHFQNSRQIGLSWSNKFN